MGEDMEIQGGQASGEATHLLRVGARGRVGGLVAVARQLGLGKLGARGGLLALALGGGEGRLVRVRRSVQ